MDVGEIETVKLAAKMQAEEKATFPGYAIEVPLETSQLEKLLADAQNTA